MIELDWGALPDWLAGIGAITALVFARAAARSAKLTNEQQSVQLRKLEESEQDRAIEQQREQAAHFAVWITLWRDDNYAPGVSLVNSNKTPMYSLTLYCCGPTEVAIVRLAVVGPNLEGRRNVSRASRALRSLIDTHDYSDLMDRGLILVAATFRDTANRWWCRYTDGSLHGGESEEEVRSLCISDIESTSNGRLRVPR